VQKGKLPTVAVERFLIPAVLFGPAIVVFFHFSSVARSVYSIAKPQAFKTTDVTVGRLVEPGGVHGNPLGHVTVRYQRDFGGAPAIDRLEALNC
jgi:hypothetical protein